MILIVFFHALASITAMVLMDGVQRMENNESKNNELYHYLEPVLFVV